MVLVSSGGGSQPTDLIVDVNSIKDESHRGLNSPQDGSRSINGTPTSTHSSLLAEGSNTGPIEFISTDGLKPAMYTTQIFTSMSNNCRSGSGTPSPIPYNDHNIQYTQSTMGSGPTGSGSAIYSTSSGRASSSGAFTVSADPYYREYFTTVASGAGAPEPIYSSQLRQGQIAYGEEVASGGATASFVERYVRQTQYHGKGVIAAAGLTVDLPSPDSGIGADAITPRDQNTLQQVSPRKNLSDLPNLDYWFIHKFSVLLIVQPFRFENCYVIIYVVHTHVLTHSLQFGCTGCFQGNCLLTSVFKIFSN